MLAVSTSWMEDGADIRQWLSEVKGFGFEAVELSYKVTQQQLMEAETVLGSLQLKVSSIHNYCPMPNDNPTDRHPSNYYRLSALEEKERLLAVQWTNTAVDTAARVRAQAVVIHAGTCDFEDERLPRLFGLYTEGKAGTDEFNRERQRVLELRKVKREPYLIALIKSLKEVLPYAQSKHIKIGLETRYYPLEIPDFEEIGAFLAQFSAQGMGYWHDVGHADMNERLGIKAHKEFLETYQDHLIGVHLHGIRGRRDHLAPFEGDMDLEQYLPYFGPEVIKVVESKPFANEGQMKEAVERLK